MAKQSPAATKRNLVDSTLDRIKNNRVAAAAIVLGICIGAIASFTEATKKLADVLSTLTAPQVSGEWRSGPAAFYPIGPELMVLSLKEAVGGQLIGTIQFHDLQGNPRSDEFGITEGKREGKKLAFSFSSGAVLYKASGGPPVLLSESVTGEASASELHLLYRREGHTGVPVTLQRTGQ